MAKIIGIDLGTTNSCVAVWEAGKATVIPNPDGGRVTPSVVAFTEKGERLVGMPAKRQAITNPRNTVYSIKRFMGRRHNEVSAEEKLVPYEVAGASDELVKVRARGKDYTPPEISAMILRYLKEAAEAYLGHKLEKAVITTPAYFNDSQRQATKDAGRIAGMDVVRIINEPTAASLAYGLEKKKKEKIAVFDLGGGTFDISTLEVAEGVFEVLSTNGDTHLGGDDWDQVLLDYIAGEFKREQGIDLKNDQMALQRLREAAEKAKCELSSSLETEINLPFITADASGPKHLVMKITRAKLEQLTEHLLKRCFKPCEIALGDAKLTPRNIDEVVLVGGMTRMPGVQKFVREFFGKAPCKGVNPDEVVAVGAAIQGAVLGEEIGKDILLLDVTPLSLGIETLGGVTTVLIQKNTTIPTSKKEVFSTASDNQPAVDIHVLQGERPMAMDNRTLGRFQLTGIAPAPRGLPQIEVAFDIDANGILNVSAKDLATNKEQSIEIKSSSGLSEEEIKRMVKEGEEHVEEDKKKRELIELRNQADQLVYTTRNTLKEYGQMISQSEREHLENALKDLEKAKSSDSIEEIKGKMSAVEEAAHSLAQAMYQKAAKEGAQAAPEGKGPEPEPQKEEEKKAGGEGPIDADFEVKE